MRPSAIEIIDEAAPSPAIELDYANFLDLGAACFERQCRQRQAGRRTGAGAARERVLVDLE